MAPERTRLLEMTRPGAVTMPGVRLIVQRGPDRGRALRLEREEVVVGTAPGADLALTDETVSRNHFSLSVSPDGYVITDLESTNGTLVAGCRVKVAYIEVGQTLEIGETRIRLEAMRQPVELQLSEAHSFGRLLGSSIAMRRVFAMLESAAPENATVLVLGETGTGKDGAAEALHEHSPRKAGPFVVVDCSAIPPNLIESELFGHERGAFTGADRRRVGAFQEADGGTLFLDEVGELPKDAQSKFLRALERREARPLGASKPITFDVRIVAATKRDLKVDVNRGLFREDLFYRLNVVTVRMPPLRERPEDIPLLARHLYREITGDQEGELPEKTVAALVKHSWPGNVRELRNRLEQLAIVGGDVEPPPATGDTRAAELEPFARAKARVIDSFERGYLSALMIQAKGSPTKAARLASMDRVHLTRLLRKLALPSGRSG